MAHQDLKTFLDQDGVAVYGSPEVASKYPRTGLGRIAVTFEQNKKRLEMFMVFLEGTVEEIDTDKIPQELKNKCRFIDIHISKALLLKAGKKTAIVQPYGEHMFWANCFVNDKYNNGNHDMSLSELSAWFTRDQSTNPFEPGLV